MVHENLVSLTYCLTLLKSSTVVTPVFPFPLYHLSCLFIRKRKDRASLLQPLGISVTHRQCLRFLSCFLLLSGQRRIFSGFFRVIHSGIHMLTDQPTEQSKQTAIEFVLQPFVSIWPFVFLTAVETSHP